MHTSKDSMWREIWKILQNFLGTKQGPSALQKQVNRMQCSAGVVSLDRFHNSIALYCIQSHLSFVVLSPMPSIYYRLPILRPNLLKANFSLLPTPTRVGCTASTRGMGTLVNWSTPNLASLFHQIQIRLAAWRRVRKSEHRDGLGSRRPGRPASLHLMAVCHMFSVTVSLILLK